MLSFTACSSMPSTRLLLILLLLLAGNLTRAQSRADAAMLTPGQMRRDLAVFRAALTTLHPGAYRYNTRADLDERFEAAFAAVAEPRSYRYFYLLLSRLAAEVRCGHTYLNPYNQPDTIRQMLYPDRVLPLLFVVVDKRIIVTENLSGTAEIAAGDVIHEINGMPAAQVIERLRVYSRTDGRNGRPKQLANMNLTGKSVQPGHYAFFDLFFPLVFDLDPAAPVRLTLRHARGGRSYRADVGLVSRTARFTAYTLAESHRNEGGPLRFRQLDARTAVLQIDDFESWAWNFDYKQYLDSLFHVVNANKSLQNIVLDIRDNEGGDDEVAREVLSYFTDKKLGCDSAFRRYYAFLSIPDSLKPYLSTWDLSFKADKSPADYVRQSNGLFFDKKYNYCNPPTPKARFNGRVWLITDGTNSSTSYFMVDLFQRNRLGTVVGQTTGGNRQGINGAQFFFLKLPESKLEIDIPLVYQTFGPERRDGGLEPDFSAPPNARDIADGRDTPLELILQKIKNK